MKRFRGIRNVGVVLALFVVIVGWQSAVAQDDVAHFVSGIVKHVDRDAKTMVVKADDGVEHTVKWTDKTTWEATKDSGKGIKEGSKVAVKYTEKAGEKTAVGVKDLGKDTDKAMK
jgi:Cu/Ag efflux protein CusF